MASSTSSSLCILKLHEGPSLVCACSVRPKRGLVCMRLVLRSFASSSALLFAYHHKQIMMRSFPRAVGARVFRLMRCQCAVVRLPKGPLTGALATTTYCAVNHHRLNGLSVWTLSVGDLDSLQNPESSAGGFHHTGIARRSRYN